MKKILICFFAWLGLSCPLFSQQEMQSYMYVHDPMLYGASFAGAYNEILANLHFSKQWINMDGSPSYCLLSGSTPIVQGLSAGLVGQYESEGITNRQCVDLLAAYRFKVTKKVFISFGIGGGVQHFDKDFGKINDEERTDPYYEGQPEHETFPQCQASFMFYSDMFHVSLSAKGLIHSNEDSEFGYKQRNHYYLSLMKKLRLGEVFSFVGESILTAEEDSPISIDFLPILEWKESFSLGLLYRFDTYLGCNIKANIGKKFFIGMAYVHSVNEMAKVNTRSSMEIMVGFKHSLDRVTEKW